jgi:hypothetical protein
VRNFVARSYSVIIGIYGVFLVDSSYVYSIIMVVE